MNKLIELLYGVFLPPMYAVHTLFRKLSWKQKTLRILLSLSSPLIILFLVEIFYPNPIINYDTVVYNLFTKHFEEEPLFIAESNDTNLVIENHEFDMGLEIANHDDLDYIYKIMLIYGVSNFYSSDEDINSIEYEGNVNKEFIGGLNTLYLSDFLNKSIHSFVKLKRKNNKDLYNEFDDINSICEYFTGFQLFYNDGIIKRYNNTAFIWAKENIIPDKNKQLGNHTYQEYYDVLAKRFIRLYTEGYLIANFYNLPKLSASYEESVLSNKENYYDWYIRLINEPHEEYYTKNTFSVHSTMDQSVTFWVRRHITQNDKAIFDLFSSIAKEFDYEWYIQKLSEYNFQNSNLDKKFEYENWLGAPDTFPKENLNFLYDQVLNQSFYYDEIENASSLEKYNQNYLTTYYQGHNNLLRHSDFYKGILRYLKAVECFKYQSENERYYNEWTHNFLGTNIQQPNKELPFTTVNPEPIKWIHSNLIPNPNDLLDQFTYQEIYHLTMKRYFRLSVESYLSIQRFSPIIQAQEYYHFTVDKNVKASDYLQEYYSNIKGYEHPLGPEKRSNTYYSPQVASGFWLRRILDGSSDEIYKGFEKVIKLYDSKWYTEKLQEYNIETENDNLLFEDKKKLITQLFESTDFKDYDQYYNDVNTNEFIKNENLFVSNPQLADAIVSFSADYFFKEDTPLKIEKIYMKDINEITLNGLYKFDGIEVLLFNLFSEKIEAKIQIGIVKVDEKLLPDPLIGHAVIHESDQPYKSIAGIFKKDNKWIWFNGFKKREDENRFGNEPVIVTLKEIKSL
ncbi:hypothetical protein KMW28_09005 [Flammeovirga yaeyamensis]|uniref:Uncharacterized protein n=1 Tax=Flammeovirga yaeyamensis TaxID=367791 RepID=A0AAX1N8X9_9BACT|nr:hypothetical protein [Flammeovirga yaeyamensis]MBB3698897.1 hypothetical protein [Flammeovirga yaeyamensis]NMF36332.1 hypothetical protein [Flammeovirga yaeyamensis]QWG03707.1 hypothetical protein KMW28_09005 [Flammeovirga yaeyamensis]